MRSFTLLAAVAFGHAAGEALEVTEATWDEKIAKPVEAGQLAFVKFLAPW